MADGEATVESAEESAYREVDVLVPPLETAPDGTIYANVVRLCFEGGALPMQKSESKRMLAGEAKDSPKPVVRFDEKTQAHQALGSVQAIAQALDFVGRRNRAIILSRNGTEVGAIVNMDDYKQYIRRDPKR